MKGEVIFVDNEWILDLDDGYNIRNIGDIEICDIFVLCVMLLVLLIEEEIWKVGYV